VAFGNQHKGSIVRSVVIDEERMRLGLYLGLVQCVSVSGLTLKVR